MGTDKNIAFSASKPLSSICVQVDDDKVDLLLKKIKEKENFNLNRGELIIFSIIKAIKEFPEFNSNYDQDNQEDNQEIFLYDSINLGHFVNLGEGAKLAVIKDAGDKSLVEISKEIKEAALKYIRGELLDEDTRSSTVSVTNLYSFPAFQVSPPIYKHQSSMFSIASRFVSWDGEKTVHKFNLTLSYDARVADCQKAIALLNKIRKTLEGEFDELH
ncbi:MAG: 2-oxo acid dehydrogenase subunit E2 [Nanoarchaeota archaeon]